MHVVMMARLHLHGIWPRQGSDFRATCAFQQQVWSDTAGFHGLRALVHDGVRFWSQRCLIGLGGSDKCIGSAGS
jgi:hypothetical protein